MKIANSIVLVTGANRGLGRELVRALVARGARKVYAAARDISTIDVGAFAAIAVPL
jgi:NAD(P)-dependent dehydrogenase (short-subunit alcohol dehydrogenase family)